MVILAAVCVFLCLHSSQNACVHKYTTDVNRWYPQKRPGDQHSIWAPGWRNMMELRALLSVICCLLSQRDSIMRWCVYVGKWGCGWRVLIGGLWLRDDRSNHSSIHIWKPQPLNSVCNLKLCCFMNTCRVYVLKAAFIDVWPLWGQNKLWTQHRHIITFKHDSKSVIMLLRDSTKQTTVC